VSPNQALHTKPRAARLVTSSSFAAAPNSQCRQERAPLMSENQNESDWKTFKKLVPEIRERYLQRLNAELTEILQNQSLTSTEQFWTLQERVRELAQILRDCFDGHSRSKMLMSLLLMRRHEILIDEDLKQFSNEIQTQIEGRSKL
jgi:hypothetical protein